MASAGLSTLRLRTPRAAAIAGVRMDQKRIARFCFQYLLHQGSLGRNDVQAHMNLEPTQYYAFWPPAAVPAGGQKKRETQAFLCTTCRVRRRDLNSSSHLGGV